MDQCEECGYGDNVHAPDCWLKPENLLRRLRGTNLEPEEEK